MKQTDAGENKHQKNVEQKNDNIPKTDETRTWEK